MADKREVVLFRKDIPAGKNDVLAERLKGDCTIERVKVRLYEGVQQSLKITPFLERRGNRREDLFTYVSTGMDYVTGDNDTFEFEINLPATNDDYLKVQAENITNDYSSATTWASGTAYSLGDLVLSTADSLFYFECTTAGTSDTAEPTWNEEEGATTTDNTVVWTAREKGYTYTLVTDIVVDYAEGQSRSVAK